MTEYELLAIMAAIMAADGERTAPGAVAAADALLDELKRHPAHAAAARSRMTEIQRRNQVANAAGRLHPQGGI